MWHVRTNINSFNDSINDQMIGTDKCTSYINPQLLNTASFVHEAHAFVTHSYESTNMNLRNICLLDVKIWYAVNSSLVDIRNYAARLLSLPVFPVTVSRYDCDHVFTRKFVMSQFVARRYHAHLFYAIRFQPIHFIKETKDLRTVRAELRLNVRENFYHALKLNLHLLSLDQIFVGEKSSAKSVLRESLEWRWKKSLSSIGWKIRKAPLG